MILALPGFLVVVERIPLHIFRTITELAVFSRNYELQEYFVILQFVYAQTFVLQKWVRKY